MTSSNEMWGEGIDSTKHFLIILAWTFTCQSECPTSYSLQIPLSLFFLFMSGFLYAICYCMPLGVMRIQDNCKQQYLGAI